MLSGQLHAPATLPPGVKSPPSPLDRGWVDPWTGVEDMERKNTCSYQDPNSDPWVVQPVATRFTDCTIPAPILLNFRDIIDFGISSKLTQTTKTNQLKLINRKRWSTA
jgi:hypothetical protein